MSRRHHYHGIMKLLIALLKLKILNLSNLKCVQVITLKLFGLKLIRLVAVYQKLDKNI